MINIKDEDNKLLRALLRKQIPNLTERAFKNYIGRHVAEPKIKEEWRIFKKMLRNSL